MHWFGVVARLVVGGVWLAAGLLKVPDPAESVRAVRAYQLLPESVVPVVALDERVLLQLRECIVSPPSLLVVPFHIPSFVQQVVD